MGAEKNNHLMTEKEEEEEPIPEQLETAPQLNQRPSVTENPVGRGRARVLRTLTLTLIFWFKREKGERQGEDEERDREKIQTVFFTEYAFFLFFFLLPPLFL